MTTKFIGNFRFNGNSIEIIHAKMPLPDKKEWHLHSIIEFNGKQYSPITDKAKENLDSVVKELESQGYIGATKTGKRKLSSIKYAIKTTGVEDFTFVKSVA